MSSDQFQDQLFPMREELAKKNPTEINRPQSSTKPQAVNTVNVENKDQKIRSQGAQEHFQEHGHFKGYWRNASSSNEENEQKKRYAENEQRRQEWHDRRAGQASSNDSFLDVYEAYKNEQRKKDKAREDFNAKYTARNKQIAEKLKKERIAEELNKQRISVPILPDQSVENQPKRKFDQRSPSVSPIKANEKLSPSKPPPAQKLREETDVSFSEDTSRIQKCHDELLNTSVSNSCFKGISNGDLIQHLSTTGLKYSSPLQKQQLISHICQKIGISEKDLSPVQKDDLNNAVAKFFNKFSKKYSSSKMSRNVSRLLSDQWSQSSFKLPHSVIIQLIDSPCQESTTGFEASTTTSQKISYEELCNVMKENSACNFTDAASQVPAIRSYILSKLSLTEEEIEDCKEELDKKIRKFADNMGSKYQKIYRAYDKLKEHILKSPTSFELPKSIWEKLDRIKPTQEQNLPRLVSESSHCEPAPKKLTVGQKQVPFEKQSKRSQQYASAKVRESHPPGAINLAAAQQPTDLGLLVRRSNSIRGITVKKALAAIKNPNPQKICMKTPSEALAYLLNNNLTKDQYNSMKAASRESHADIWPNYNKVLEAKAECRPEGIVIQETSAYVPLQNLLDHTTKRILFSDTELTQRIEELAVENNGELGVVIYFKYGFDGCGSFNTYMQKTESGKVPDGSTLLTSQMVPLQAVAVGKESVLLHNSRTPNNANSCRPIRLCFERETKETIRNEAARLREEVKNLSDLVLIEEPKVTVSYKGLFTMVDGKVLNELTENPASTSCPICQKTSRQMCDPNEDFTPRPGTLQHGASILHFGIRTFELLCNIGYRQDIQKYNVRLTPEEKATMAVREKQVKGQFREKLGLIVDQRKDGGAGNTTTGNVARKAFANPGNVLQ